MRQVTRKVFLHQRIALVIFALILLPSAAVSQTTSKRRATAAELPEDIWISASHVNGEGKGTRQDPFDGSTEAKLDAVLAASISNQTLHFGRGIFQKKGIINGGAQVKAGQRWTGAGKDLTTFKLGSMWHPPGAFIDYALGNGSNRDAAGATIENMTVDCNAEYFLTTLGTNAVKADAIQLHGTSNLTVRHVRIINNHGDAKKGLESFPLLLGGFASNGKDTWCKNALIDHVTIDRYANNHTYGGAISFFLVDGGIIENCTVRGNRNGTTAYGFLGANCRLANSQAIDCGTFFYAELNNGDPAQIAAHGGWQKFTIKGCEARIGSGFRDNNQAKFGSWFCLIANGKANDSRGLDGLNVKDNQIFINRGTADIENGALAHVYRATGVSIKNFVITNNHVWRDPHSARNPGGQYYRYTRAAENVTYANNQFDDGWSGGFR